MIRCSAQQLSKMYGGNPVFDNISLEVYEDDRIGLIGRNGSGKTTLLKLLAQTDSPDEGDIHVQKGTRIGYLEQIWTYTSEMTVYDVLKQPFAEVLDTEKQLNTVTEKMADPNLDSRKLNRLLAHYDHLLQAFEKKGGYEMTSTIHKVVNGLGIAKNLLDQSFVSLSGGGKNKSWPCESAFGETRLIATR